MQNSRRMEHSIIDGQLDILLSPCCFSKNASSKHVVKHYFFFFNYHKSHFFRKFHWNFSYRSDNMKIFSININYFHRFFRIFWQFLVTKKLIMSAYYRWCHHFFLFQSTLSRLLGVWEAGGCSNWPLPEKTTLRKPSLFRVKSFFDSQGIFFW